MDLCVLVGTVTKNQPLTMDIGTSVTILQSYPESCDLCTAAYAFRRCEKRFGRERKHTKFLHSVFFLAAP